MSEETANTHGVQSVIEPGDDHEVRMILGDRDKIRHTGIIRGGKKVPKGSCSAEEKRKFVELEAQGLSYDDIDRELGGTPKSKTSKLRPTNVDHFIVRECDFRRPQDAQLIREKYADSDGHVRRIPCWFTTDDISKVIPHNFRAFGGNGSVRASSFYDENDQTAFRYLPKGKDGKGDWIELRQTPNVDEEELIDEVSKLCGAKVEFGGMYRCNVVGLKTFGEVIVPTQSWFGLADAIAILKRVKSILGRFNGLVNGQHFLVLTKVPQEVKTPDGKRQTQHIVTIDADVDPMELARHAEMAPARGVAAINAFNGHTQQSAVPKHTTKEEPTKTAEAQAPSEPTNDEDMSSEENEILTKAVVGIRTLGERAKIPVEHINVFAQEHLNHTLDKEQDVQVLRDLYKVINDNLRKDHEGFKAHCAALHEKFEQDSLPFN